MKKVNLKNIATSGFTLVELLIVIAIIGVLASVILPRLTAARIKAIDAAVKSVMANARSQAQIFYETSQVYTNVCTASGGIGSLMANAATRLDSTALVGDTTQAFVYDPTGLIVGASVCHDGTTAWAAMTTLLGSTTNSGWCVDSTGASEEATDLAANALVCP